MFKSDDPANTTRLSHLQIALFFVLGYFLLPLSPLWFVLSAFYQLCLVQGTLSSHARVVTTVVCMFFLIAWIPFVNLAVFFTRGEDDRKNVSIRINGLAPMALLSIFYVWGSVIGYRYYTIEASYEQERDRQSVRKLEKQELSPPLQVSTAVAIAARGERVPPSTIMLNTDSNIGYGTLDAGGAPLGPDSPGFDRVIMSPRDSNLTGFSSSNQTATAFDTTGSPILPHHTNNTLSGNSNVTGGGGSPRNSRNDSSGEVGDIADSAADAQAAAVAAAAAAANTNANAAQSLNTIFVRNAFDLYNLLKEEVGSAANQTLLLGLIVSSLTIGTARIYEWQNPPKSPDSLVSYNESPLYELSTVFFAGFFFVFYTTLIFVKQLYSQNIQLVYDLTYLGRGSTDLRADREMMVDDSDDDDDETSGNMSAGGGDGSIIDRDDRDGVSSVNQSMNYISATAFSAYESSTGPNAAAAALLGGSTSAQFVSEATAASLTQSAAKAVVVELLDPYNVTHLRAWEEVRKIAADQISSPTSVLNSFFTPTVFICAFGLFGLGLFLGVRVLFLPSTTSPNGPFFITVCVLALVFLLYLVLIYNSARETRRHFKAHETIVSRIAFDVARELEHCVRHSAQGILFAADEANRSHGASPSSQRNLTSGGGGGNNPSSSSVAAANSSSPARLSPHQNNTNVPSSQPVLSTSAQAATQSAFGGGGFTARHQQTLVSGNGEAGGLVGVSALVHEPPSTEAELTFLFDSVNSLCNMMSVATPRPLFVGMEQRNVRYFLAYVFAVTALLLFFALLTSMRKGLCRYNVIEHDNVNKTTVAPSFFMGVL